jgi:hypothetical protein
MLWRGWSPAKMAADEHQPCILVVDGDPGVATGLTQELEHRFERDYHILGTLSAHGGLDTLDRLGAAGRPDSGRQRLHDQLTMPLPSDVASSSSGGDG